MATRMPVGEAVDVFYRASDHGGYFPVASLSLGTTTPRIGITDGWMRGTLEQPFDPAQCDPNRRETWPCVRFRHGLWYNREGHRYDVDSNETRGVSSFPVNLVRAPQADRPDVTIVLVRWANNSVHPVTEGDGGWGDLGCPASDLYLGNMQRKFHEVLGPRYEILSVFVQCSADLARLEHLAPSLPAMCRGRARGAMYYLWPVEWYDTGAPSYAGYVERGPFFAAMRAMEAAGVSTRFPHPANMYEAIASKGYMAQFAVIPGFHMPATTMVSKDLVVASPENAAETCIGALSYLRDAKRQFTPGGAAAGHELIPTGPVLAGVVKLGWSWEATDVWIWRSKADLAEKLAFALQQPGSQASHAYVQEFVEFDFELRLFWVDTWPEDVKTVVQPRASSYNAWNTVDAEGKPRSFVKLTRDAAVQKCNGDAAAVAHAEREAVVISNRVLMWLRTLSAEPPASVRTDFLVKYAGNGECQVHLGEVGEAGSCCLGWEGGPHVLWQSLAQSCFRSAADAPKLRAATQTAPGPLGASAANGVH